MNTAKGFSERIRSRRIELGMSQRDLSREADISPPQLSRYESCIATPRADIASRIARTLKVNLAWLINGTGEKFVRDVIVPTTDNSDNCPCMRHNVTLSLSDTTYRKLVELAFYNGRSQPEEASYLLSKVIYEDHIELVNEQIINQNNELLKKISQVSNDNELAKDLLTSLKDYQTQSVEREKSFKEYRELSKKHLEIYSTFVSKLDQLVKEKHE